MKTKKVVIEFEVDQSLEFADLCNAFSDAKIMALKEVDRQLGRLGTGRGSAAGYPTIKFLNFDGINRVCRNGRWDTIRRRLTHNTSLEA